MRFEGALVPRPTHAGHGTTLLHHRRVLRASGSILAPVHASLGPLHAALHVAPKAVTLTTAALSAAWIHHRVLRPTLTAHHRRVLRAARSKLTPVHAALGTLHAVLHMAPHAVPLTTAALTAALIHHRVLRPALTAHHRLRAAPRVTATEHGLTTRHGAATIALGHHLWEVALPSSLHRGLHATTLALHSTLHATVHLPLRELSQATLHFLLDAGTELVAQTLLHIRREHRPAVFATFTSSTRPALFVGPSVHPAFDLAAHLDPIAIATVFVTRGSLGASRTLALGAFTTHVVAIGGPLDHSFAFTNGRTRGLLGLCRAEHATLNERRHQHLKLHE